MPDTLCVVDDAEKVVLIRALLMANMRALKAADTNNLNLKETNRRLLEQLRKEVRSIPLVSSLILCHFIGCWIAEAEECCGGDRGFARLRRSRYRG
jgi:hypothetical protein